MSTRFAVVIAGLAVVFAGDTASASTSASATAARSATEQVKATTKSAASKTGDYLSDAEITAAVKTKLLADSKVSALKIGVETNHRVVTLDGTVASAADRARAARIARNTHGVKSVVNKLTVERTARTTGRTERSTEPETKGPPAVRKGTGKAEDTARKIGDETKDAAKTTGRVLADTEITAAVKTKMIADSNLKAFDIHVDTTQGVVTLSGTVRSEAEKAHAVNVAKNTSGVRSVVDNLTVK